MFHRKNSKTRRSRFAGSAESNEDFLMTNRIKKTFCCYLFFGIAAVLLFIECHPSKVIECSALRNPITIDGSSADWAGLITHDPDQPFGIGIANDGKYLYICLVSDDRRIHRQVMRYGLTVWFEGGTAAKQRLGIRYPTGLAGTGFALRSSGEEPRDTGFMREKIEEMLDAIEVIGPGKKMDTLPMKLTVAESSFDLKMKAVSSMEQFTYELRVPLSADSTTPYAVPPAKKSLITLVLESSAPSETGTSEEGREGGPGMGRDGGGFGGVEGLGGGGYGGGHRGGGGGHHGGRGGGSGYQGGHHEPPEPFTVELAVKLAGK